MTYRVQVDLSFKTQEDADNFKKYIGGITDQLYVPTLKEITDSKAELWTYDRLVSKVTTINDYDDEKQMRPGESVSTVELVVPIDKAI